MPPQLISAEKKERLIKPLQQLPSGGSFQKPPKARAAKEVRRDFEKTGKYNKAFLDSLEQGLSKSSIFKKR